MAEAVSKEKQFRRFFMRTKSIVRSCSYKVSSQKWSEKDRDLSNELREVKSKVHNHLCNNIDTPSVIYELSGLVSLTQKYMKEENSQIKPSIVTSICGYILDILRCLGIVESSYSEYESEELEHPDKIVAPYVQAIVDFRDKVKQVGNPALLKQWDRIRDDIMPTLGVAIKDSPSWMASQWTKGDPQRILKAIASKKEMRDKSWDLDYFRNLTKNLHIPSEAFSIKKILSDPSLGVAQTKQHAKVSIEKKEETEEDKITTSQEFYQQPESEEYSYNAEDDVPTHNKEDN